MTSTLSANNTFGKDYFAGSVIYGRNAYSNSFAIDSNIPSNGFQTKIWQPTKNDLLPLRTQMARNGDALALQIHETRLMKSEHSHQTQKDFASATSRVKAAFQTTNNASEKQSPTVLQGHSSTSTEPSSANSRSNNDSTTLTPSSNISIADQFPAHLNTSRDTKLRMTTSQSYQGTENAWTNAKEFRPNLLSDLPRIPSANGTRFSPAERNPYLDSQTTTSSRPWTQQDSDTGYSQFRPVLPATVTAVSNNKFPLRGRNNGYELDRPTYNSNRLYRRTLADPYQNQYVKHLQPYDASMPRSRMYLQPLQGNERNNHLNGNSHSNYCNLPAKQQIYCKGSQYLDPQVVHNEQLYNNGWVPEDYYRKPANSYNDQAPSIQVDTGLQNFPAYNYYADDTGGYGLQTLPPSFQHSGDGLQDGQPEYYNNPAWNFLYRGIEPVQERPPENQRIYRSPLLEEFRVNKSRKYDLKDIYDHVVEFSGDQVGSRFIQQKLEVANSDEKDRIFSEVARDSRQLMTDVFGNYVIQKMFDHGNQSQKRLLANHMKGHVQALSLQMYGCRVIQKAFEHILTDQQGTLIKELDGSVLEVVENQNGNHVIQKAIELIPGEHIQFIVDAHRGHVHHLSKHPYGCRVIQRMLEHCQPSAKRQILDELHLNISDLIQDAFGNYVVQHVIANGEPSDRKAVIDKVQSKLLENAMHKFASNVVEKALDHANEHQRRAMLQTLTGRDEDGQSTATRLLTHQYGNYVIQKSTAYLTGQTLATIIAEMESYLSQLQRVSSGKQVSALQKSILEARKRLDRLDRLDRQSLSINNLQFVPTHPRTSFARR